MIMPEVHIFLNDRLYGFKGKGRGLLGIRQDGHLSVRV